MNVYLPNLRLPSAYQEVEYIESSGTQYIDTGFIPSNTSKIEISMGGWSQYSEFSDLFGARASWNTNPSTGRGFHLGYHQIATTTYYGMFGREYNNSSGLYANTLSFANGSDHIIEMSSAGIYEDGTSKFTYTNYTFTSPVNWTIFALNDNGTVNSNSSYKLYYAKLRDNGTLVRDLIPCYRKSDGVIGLYDLVNNQFYTNSGTGTFSKGDDVTMTELNNFYIGEYQQVLVFDFQNDGMQGCTLSTTSGFGYETGQGIYASSSSTVGCGIKLPSSVYGKALKSVTMNVYYPTGGSGNAFGMIIDSGYSFRYSREMGELAYIGFADGKTTPKSNIGSMNGEMTITFNFSSGTISGAVGGTSYTISDSYCDTIRDSFINGTFNLLIVTWGNTNKAYIRKATIITE